MQDSQPVECSHPLPASKPHNAHQDPYAHGHDLIRIFASAAFGVCVASNSESSSESQEACAHRASQQGKPVTAGHTALLSRPQKHGSHFRCCNAIIRHLRGIMCVLQLKGVLMAIYFGADHLVWAGQAGLVSNKQLLEGYFAAQCSSLPKGSLPTNRPLLASELH